MEEALGESSPLSLKAHFFFELRLDEADPLDEATAKCLDAQTLIKVSSAGPTMLEASVLRSLIPVFGKTGDTESKAVYDVKLRALLKSLGK